MPVLFEMMISAAAPLFSRPRTTPMGTELRPAPEVKAALDELRADAQHGAPAREPPQSFKSLSALRSVFDVLDPLSELLAETLKGWQTPVVVVFGNETSGKSSLLERLAMMPLLPRGEGTCTRLPIVLKLRHAKQPSPPVLVVRDSTTGKEEVRRVVSVAAGEGDVRNRATDGAVLEDKFDRAALPKVMQVKDFGFQGRTKYTHLSDQDTTFVDRDNPMNGWLQRRHKADDPLRRGYDRRRGGTQDIDKAFERRRR